MLLQCLHTYICILTRFDFTMSVQNKFGHLKVEELKSILRNRGAKVTGEKKELIERLKFYDENNNFLVKAPSHHLLSDHGSIQINKLTPAADKYRDINANTDLPKLNQSNITNYLDRFNVGIEDGQKLYENQFLVSARLAKDDHCIFLRGECKAEMTKSWQYVSDVVITPPCTVAESQCECPAGQGPTAHCKHVVALLLGTVQLTQEEKIILHRTCTQELQSFHRPQKPYFGTPLKCQDLPSVRNRTKNISFSPCDFKSITDEDFETYKKKYNDRVRNLGINFCGSHSSSMPLKHTIMPANTYGVAWDHCYASSPEEDILQSLKVFRVSYEDIREIEEATRSQADGALWHNIRNNRLTSSNFHSICASVSHQAKGNLVQRLMNPVTISSKYVQHGKDCEPKAIALYSSRGVEVNKCGLFLSQTHPFLGASPDGLIGDETVLEVKCPYNQTNMKISDETVPFLMRNEFGQVCLRDKHQYDYQIQGQMFVTNRLYANLLVFTFKDLCIIDIPRNDKFIADMVCDLQQFYDDYFKPALLEKYLFKNYGQSFFK